MKTSIGDNPPTLLVISARRRRVRLRTDFQCLYNRQRLRDSERPQIWHSQTITIHSFSISQLPVIWPMFRHLKQTAQIKRVRLKRRRNRRTMVTITKSCSSIYLTYRSWAMTFLSISRLNKRAQVNTKSNYLIRLQPRPPPPNFRIMEMLRAILTTSVIIDSRYPSKWRVWPRQRVMIQRLLQRHNVAHAFQDALTVWTLRRHSDPLPHALQNRLLMSQKITIIRID